MNKTILPVVAALAAFGAVPAHAADMPVKAPVIVPAPAPSPFDVLFGVAFTSDYILRGVSQSGHKPAVQGYFEADYTATDWLKLYAGVWGSSLYTGFADAEFDITAGARLSFGNFGLDVGYVQYQYPGGLINGFGSYGEFYAKPSYKFNDWLTVGAIIDGGNNFNNKVTLAPPWIGNGKAYYYSANAVWTLPWKPAPDVTLSINPEIGRQVYGSGPQFNLGIFSYTYWDVGLDINWKAITIDLRYWDTNTGLSRNPVLCAIANSTQDACAGKFVVTLKFDTSISQLK